MLVSLEENSDFCNVQMFAHTVVVPGSSPGPPTRKFPSDLFIWNIAYRIGRQSSVDERELLFASQASAVLSMSHGRGHRTTALSRPCRQTGV
jgi:hypothetical protein